MIPGKGPGQSRAEMEFVKNVDGKLIRARNSLLIEEISFSIKNEFEVAVMAEVHMTTSDLKKALRDVIPWADFCQNYSNEKKSYLLRNDGALTSADLKMKFDLEKVVVQKQNLDAICSAALDGAINVSDVSFIANAILLSAFDFVDDALEDTCHFLSDVEKLDEIREAKSTLCS